MVNLQHARAMLEPDVCLCGNFDPVAVLLHGTPDDVRKACLRCIQQAGHLMCFPPGVKCRRIRPPKISASPASLSCQLGKVMIEQRPTDQSSNRSRRRVQAALDFAAPDRLPRDVWGGRFISRYRPEDWQALHAHFPIDFDRAPSVLGASAHLAGDASAPGARIDEWGSEWTALEVGVAGEVTCPAIREWCELAAFSPPWEMVNGNQVEAANAFCRMSNAFVLGEVGPGPFERLQFLRGSEALYLDLAEEPAALGQLIEQVHEFYRRHVALWCQTEVDAIVMGDDWGSQSALLISPRQWRRLFRPLYAEYFALARAAEKRVFLHSDGMIREIIPDLIDIGVEALNSQLFCMDIEELGRTFREQLTFWGEIDRQYVLPFGSVEDVRKAVRRVKQVFGGEAGGLIAQLSWGIDDPLANILAAFEEWDAE